MNQNGESQNGESQTSASGWWIEAGAMTRIAVFVVVASGIWFMLKELAPLLRPLLLAILLCYVILPMHSRIRRDRSEFKTIAIMTGAALALVIGLGVLVTGSLISLNTELPRLTNRAKELTAGSKEWAGANLPSWAKRSLGDLDKAEGRAEQYLHSAGGTILTDTAGIFMEAVVVGIYVIFLLLEANRLRGRVRGGFDGPRAQQILSTMQTINDGIANYLKAKVRSSAILALPVTLLLFLFGVNFAVMWGLLTFLCNFIPYVGSVIACGSPILFAFLDLPPGWQPIAVSVLLILCHVMSASFVEPALIGKAVGLSPLVILISLTFWGLCWGMVGMFLAVPLTVAVKIVLANIEITKPIAVMLGDD
jgi:AI-2 transport protein TqsA